MAGIISMVGIISVAVQVLAREPASFWRENVVAVVILLRILARMSKWGKRVINVGSFIILRSGERVISFTKVNSANSSGEKW